MTSFRNALLLPDIATFDAGACGLQRAVPAGRSRIRSKPHPARAESSWLPTIKVADAIGWKSVEKPVAAGCGQVDSSRLAARHSCNGDASGNDAVGDGGPNQKLSRREGKDRATYSGNAAASPDARELPPASRQRHLDSQGPDRQVRGHGPGSQRRLRRRRNHQGLDSRHTFEHMEIAAYKVLIAAAEACGDAETSAVCQRILAEEEAMAKWLSENIGDVTAKFLAREQNPISRPSTDAERRSRPPAAKRAIPSGSPSLRCALPWLSRFGASSCTAQSRSATVSHG